MNKELRYESPLHQKILDALRKRVDNSGNAISKKTSDFSENEDIFAGYIHETTADKVRKSKRDKGEPKFTTMKVPFSYAVLMSAHTYWTSALMGRDPVLQFAGRHDLLMSGGSDSHGDADGTRIGEYGIGYEAIEAMRVRAATYA